MAKSEKAAKTAKKSATPATPATSKGAKTTRRSVLQRQKPKRTPKQQRAMILRRLFYASLILLLAAAGSVFFYGGQRLSDSVVAWLAKPTAWRLSLKLEGDRPLDDKAVEGILATAQRHLGSGSPAEIRKTAALVQKQAAFSTVHFLKTAPDQMVLSLKQRFPVMCIQADKLRYIATDGSPKAFDTAVVFGEAESEAACKGPLLTGVFGREKKFVLGDDSTLVLEPEELEAVREAVQLLDATATTKFQLKSLEYRNFRGFFVVMKDNEAEVALGRAPFDEKLEKLSELMTKLSKKGDVASRIELDYQGKAFIKLKKM